MNEFPDGGIFTDEMPSLIRHILFWSEPQYTHCSPTLRRYSEVIKSLKLRIDSSCGSVTPYNLALSSNVFYGIHLIAISQKACAHESVFLFVYQKF